MNEHQTLDLRSPWVISIHELVRRPGELKEFRREIPAPAGVSVELVGVLEGSPIDVDLRLESVSEGVLATGTLSAEFVGECSRCLGAVREDRDFDLQELYYYPGHDAEEDALFVVDEHIDLDPPMRDAIVLELPFSPLCREDCLGLCPVCGFNLNDDPDHDHGEQIDPRWAGLQSFQSEDASEKS
ncbi:YceD family protein [Brooklawnia sp.]|uniref:YceD family protein n=1 Tax=Brooklawnia sp. TaxID=2699740 RepID=UPI00311D302B